jgi:phage regulator Rha-like protein
MASSLASHSCTEVNEGTIRIISGMQIIRSIQNRIYEIRGERVMLDFDLAALYEVETKVLNQSVKRNIKRFPSDFMFQLSKEEWDPLRSQIATSNIQIVQNEGTNLSQIVTSSRKHRGTTYRPYAFTEQGVAMLSGVLNSDKAINMNIAIMRAFVEIRKILLRQSDLKEQLKEIKERLGEHDTQLNQIYDALENLLDEKASQQKWEERERIGF